MGSLSIKLLIVPSVAFKEKMHLVFTLSVFLDMLRGAHVRFFLLPQGDM